MISLGRGLVPVASERDAEAPCAALRPFFGEIERIAAVHAVEMTGGAPDTVPSEKRRTAAREFLALLEKRVGTDIPVDARIGHGTDIGAAPLDEDTEIGAKASVVRPRSGSGSTELLTGVSAMRLVTDSDVPAVSLPDPTDS